jgi:2-dehydro-3-deoxyphosphogluconate aldolase/(4S)-4-hydroxy-2-oxoglutarate aldolase
MEIEISTLVGCRTLVIFRKLELPLAAAAAEVLYELGLRAYEVTLDSEDALETIEALRIRLPSDVLVGAGTVVAREEVGEAEAAGAGFIVSPNTDPVVIRETKERGLVSVPGAYTPTEIITAVRAGGDIVKLFPVKPAGVGYIEQVRGPLAQVPLLASGGVSSDVAAECFAAGCAMVGVGHQFFLGVGATTVDREVATSRAAAYIAAHDQATHRHRPGPSDGE